MPLMGGTLRAPSLYLIIPFLHHRYPSLRLRLLGHSIKHFSSPASSTNFAVSPQRHSVEHPVGSPTKPRTKQIKPPKRNQTELVQTPLNIMNARSLDAAVKEKKAKSVKQKRREFHESPAGLLQRGLDQCSKRGNTVRALELYDSAVADGIPLSISHYNCLLYLCSLPSSPGVSNGQGDSACDVALKDPEAKFNDSEVSKMAVERGFEIYKRICEDPDVEPNEATLTSMARLAAMKGAPHLAFDLVKQMVKMGMPPKLRSYGPALYGFCDKLNVEMAHEVETHMDTHGVIPEEAELAALLRAYAIKGRAHHVYRLLHRIRTLIRQVSEPTAEIIQSWFQSDAAAAVGASKWDIQKIKQGIVQGGGGWHGQGWLGTGQWRVERSVMSEDGVCKNCREKLVCIDIDPSETEGFARSLMDLPYFKKNRYEFSRFKEWLKKNGPFDAVIDAANVGLCNQREFNFYQINSVIKRIMEVSPSKKMPLVILHARRVYDETAAAPKNRQLIESWKRANCLYYTPKGSNDDWYWLYAAVCNKCLLVTNDEMRDHLFQLLGTSFFPRWKEKHQVRMTFSHRGPTLHMPPPYSIVIQESESGSWHIPTTTGDDLETPRQWICATRETTKAVAGGITSAKSDTDNMKRRTQRFVS
ncbi:proteinaceous RNase P 1 [Rhynchospora pubera]|uniref:ribonuclease P n=1 Tax=Rhynchospora pubera TaxID=906938 RepID=A0AAV8GKD8_9POAL|nr:proteinaceous RNase P 1 [Rhynchospora pubera]